jgi:hypothetical protein
LIKAILSVALFFFGENMSDEIQAMSYTQSALVYYNTASTNPGIFIEWERSGASGVEFYKIQKS